MLSYCSASYSEIEPSWSVLSVWKTFIRTNVIVMFKTPKKPLRWRPLREYKARLNFSRAFCRLFVIVTVKWCDCDEQTIYCVGVIMSPPSKNDTQYLKQHKLFTTSLRRCSERAGIDRWIIKQAEKDFSRQTLGVRWCFSLPHTVMSRWRLLHYVNRTVL